MALACRMAVFAAASPDRSSLLSWPDSSEYLAIAKNIAAGRGFSVETAPPYRPDVRRTPVYPLAIAGVFRLPIGSTRVAALVSVVSGAAVSAAVYGLTAELFGAGPALVAGLLLATDVISITYSVLVLTESLFTFLLVAAIAMLASRPRRPGGAIGGGLVLGAATLCRPAGFLLAPIALPACTWKSRRGDGLRGYLKVNAVFLAVALVWIARNSIVAGVPTLSSIGAVNLYLHRAAAIEAFREGRDVETVRQEWTARFDAISSGWSESEKIDWMTAQARGIIVRHPFVYLRTALGGIGRMMSSDVEELCNALNVEQASAAGRALQAIASIQLWIVYPAALLGIAAAARDPIGRRAALVPLAFIAYFVLLSGAEAYSRFRVPVMPFVIVLSGAGLYDYRALLTRAKIRSYFPSTTSQR